MTDTHLLIDHIYTTGYFTNHGPVASELESALESFFDIENAIIISNESLATVIALSGMTKGGTVAVSKDTPMHIVNGINWVGLKPTFFDSEFNLFAFFSDYNDPVIDKQEFDIVIFDPVTERKLTLSTYQSFQSSGMATITYYNGLPHKSDFLKSSIARTRICLIGENADTPSSSCAVILTAENELARIYRNIRSSYGARETVPVMATANGRVSEYQAGVALKFFQNAYQTAGLIG